MADETCEKRINTHLKNELATLRTLLELSYKDCETYDDDLGNLYEYGLSFDYVAPDTFSDQDEGYFRYQLSWGGPSDEFRFYVNPDFSVHRIEYAFLDWGDGATRRLYDEDYDLLEEIYEYLWNDNGLTKQAYEEGMEE